MERGSRQQNAGVESGHHINAAVDDYLLDGVEDGVPDQDTLPPPKSGLGWAMFVGDGHTTVDEL